MQDSITYTQLLIHAALALFGAVVHAAKAHRLGQSKTLTDFASLVLMASFSGVMFSIAGFHFFPDQQYLTMAMAGTGGFLGVEGLAIVIAKVQELFTKK